MKYFEIYLDVCCINRPFDDQSQSRIHLEAEAILLIMTKFQTGEWQWLGSSAVDYEISQIPDYERRRRVDIITGAIHQSISLSSLDVIRAKELQTLGFKQWDALHLVHPGVNKATVLAHPSTGSGCEKPPPEPVEGGN